MAKQNTKTATGKDAVKPEHSEPLPAAAEQPADIALEQPLTGQEPDGNEAPEQVPTPGDLGEAAPAESAPTETKVAAAKSSTRSAGKAPAAKGAKTVRETAAQSVAREVFKRHPDKRTVYVTSDGTPFFAKCDADNHARTLNDPAVTIVTNETRIA